MLLNAMKLNNIDGLRWPDRCPHCGAEFKEGEISGFDLKIKKGLKGYLAGGLAPKHLFVKLCAQCAKKISNFRSVEAIGGTVMFVAIIGPILLKRFLRLDSVSYVYIAGTAFWVGVVLMSIAEVGMKQNLGVECRLLSTNRWSLKIRNDLCRNEFSSLNSAYIDRT
ncbi:MAG TPA: hypothetical protein VHO84_14210 [Syntrophorhabdaceae bacterium]|nr:hypothetical protein [Syntrophorhabdaceae bacterium]